MNPHRDSRRNGPQERLALTLFSLWLLGIAGTCWAVLVLEYDPLDLGVYWTVMSIVIVVSWGYVWMTFVYERYAQLVLLPPVLRGHWRRLRRMFKVDRLQANPLRTPAKGIGEIGDFQIKLLVLADRESVEIHAEAIPGPPVSIPWSELEYIRVIRDDEAADPRAHLRIRQLPRMPISIPWLAEFDRFVPIGQK